MVARSLRCPRGALLLLTSLLLLPLKLGWAAGGRGPAPSQALSGALALPLVRALLSQAPPSAKARRQAGGPPLRYMLELYRSVADRHGRPRKNRQLATNTVRLVRPFAKTRQPSAGERSVRGAAACPGVAAWGVSCAARSSVALAGRRAARASRSLL